MNEPTTPLTDDEIQALEAAKDAELHGTSVAEAIDNIKKITDVDFLRELAAREARNPKNQGGRKTLLAALEAQIAEIVEAAADGAGDAGGPADAAKDAAAGSATPQAEGMVRCRVKATAADFHLPIDGGHVSTPAGTELSLSAEQFERLANHLERID